MAPETHLLASWVIAAKATDNRRDCTLVTLAGFLPDLDGLGLLIDLVAGGFGYRTQYYATYHHFLLHGLYGGLLFALVMAVLANRKWRVGVFSLLVYHLHILFDLVGSRGPAPEDLWPIFYLGPFDREMMWIWKGQWRLDAWPNRVFSVCMLGLALWLPLRLGYSVVGVFSKRADAIFVEVLRKWRRQIGVRFARSG